MVRDVSGNNLDFEITVYANAHHGFDCKGLPVNEEYGYAAGNCYFRMRSFEALLMNFLDISMITPFRQKVALVWCADQGTNIECNLEARAKSFNFARKFIIKNLSHDFLQR